MHYRFSQRLLVRWLACAVCVWLTSCSSAALVSPGHGNQSARGTLSGHVSGTDGSYPVARRLVEAVDPSTGQRFSTKTGRGGGYTFLLAPGTYRIEVTVARGEVVVKQPQPVEVRSGELTTGIDVILGGAGVFQ